MSAMKYRKLGRNGPEVSALGLGCWAIGGPFFAGAGFRQTAGQALGWGQVDDAESRRAIDCALDCGIDFFDTADAYGTGHSERVLGAALKGRRDRVVIATKFGNTYDEVAKELTGGDASPAYIRRACEASLRRLGTDWIDLYQLHLGDLPPEEAEAVAESLEGLCEAGLIRGYGWSTDDPARAALFAGRPRALAVQHAMNVLSPAPEMLALCRREELAGIVRSPLAMGLLSGKYGAESRLPADDIRAGPPDWLAYFREGGGAAPEMLARLEAIREALTSEGRSLVQGALAWIWASAETAIPIPGFRREDQVRELAEARAFGALRPAQMAEISALLTGAAA